MNRLLVFLSSLILAGPLSHAQVSEKTKPDEAQAKNFRKTLTLLEETNTLVSTTIEAEKGDAQAQCNLGVMYANGVGGPKDEAEAVKWFSKAAEQNCPQAQYNLGVMYANGMGVPKNEEEAHVWINLAGANGDEKARALLVQLEKRMTLEQKAEATKRATELFKKFKRD